MKFQIFDAQGRTIEVKAVDWMMAMTFAIKQWNLEVSCWTCETHEGGEVRVLDPRTGAAWLLRPAGAVPSGAQPSAPRRAATDRRAPKKVEPAEELVVERGEPPVRPVPGRLVAAHTNAPIRPSPVPDTLASIPPTGLVSFSGPAASGPPDDLAVQLFELSSEIAEAGSVNAACQKALEVVLSLVPCEAGSVLRGTVDDAGLKFVAASGPAADTLIGDVVAFGQGIVGAAFDVGVTILVNDVSRDARHLPSFDERTGFRTRSLAAAPVRSAQGSYGVIELLNPTRPFESWHIEVLETVSQSLAATLAGA